MKHYFDRFRNKPLKVLHDVAYDELTGNMFPITEQDGQFLFEIDSSSYDTILTNMTQLFSTKQEDVFVLSGPILNNINEELKKYGL